MVWEIYITHIWELVELRYFYMSSLQVREKPFKNWEKKVWGFKLHIISAKV